MLIFIFIKGGYYVYAKLEEAIFADMLIILL